MKRALTKAAIMASMITASAPSAPSVAAAQIRGTRARFGTESGLLVLVEESHDLPLVDFQITLRTGSAHDPADRDGLSRFVARMIRMGTRNMSAPEVEEQIDSLGAQLSIETSPSYTRFAGSVIKRNLDPFMRLMGQLMARPAFRAADVAQVQRETIADIIDMRDNDRGLAAKHFREVLFGSHPYGRTVIGLQATVRAVTRDEVVRHYETHYVASNIVLGLAGDVNEAEARALVSRHFGALRTGAAPPDRVEPPAERPGRRVRIVDKPDRTQTQIFIGALGSRPLDPDHIALGVANTAFGGTFTARLMKEVRSERGWSYGAYSRLGADRQREAWYMWTFPAARDAVPCMRLELELLERLLTDGITEDELRFAESYLANSFAFDIDTAGERLEQRIEIELLGLPRDYYDRYVANVRAVTRDQANEALRHHLNAQNLAIVLVATARDLRPEVARLPHVTTVEVLPFDRD